MKLSRADKTVAIQVFMLQNSKQKVSLERSKFPLPVPTLSTPTNVLDALKRIPGSHWSDFANVLRVDLFVTSRTTGDMLVGEVTKYWDFTSHGASIHVQSVAIST